MSSDSNKNLLSIHRLPAFAGALGLIVGCGAAPGDGSENSTETGTVGASEPVAAVHQAVVTSGCIPSTKDFVFVGSSRNALTGAQGSFAFAMDANGYYPACEGPPGVEAKTDEAFLSTKYELDQFVTKSFSATGSASYAGYSGSVNVSDELAKGSTFSNNELLYVVRLSSNLKTVTLRAEATLSDKFVEFHKSGVCGAGVVGCENGIPVHNEFGDVFVKTSYLGNRLYIALHATITEGTKYSREKFKAALKASYQNAIGVTSDLVTSSELAEMKSLMRVEVHGYTLTGASIPRPSTSLASVKASVDAFNALEAKGLVLPDGSRNYTEIATELAAFDTRTDARINLAAQSFPWRARATSIAKDKEYLSMADAIAANHTNAFNLANWAAELQGMLPFHLESNENASQPAPTWDDWAFASWVKDQYTNYRTAVGKSYRFAAKRSPGYPTTGMCMGTAGAGNLDVGSWLMAEPCAVAEAGSVDDQLFRLDAATKHLLTIDGNCIGVLGTSHATGALVIESCDPADKDQRWNTGAPSSVKISAFSTRLVQRWRNDAAGSADIWLAADGPLDNTPKTMSSQGWSRGNYAQYDWTIIQ